MFQFRGWLAIMSRLNKYPREYFLLARIYTRYDRKKIAMLKWLVGGGIGTVVLIVIIILILWAAGVFNKKESIDVRRQAVKLVNTYDRNRKF
jgi:hypothetical protein